MKNSFREKWRSFVNGSWIVRTLKNAVDAFYRKLKIGWYGAAFGTYDGLCEAFEDGVVGGAIGKGRQPFGKWFAAQIEGSRIIRALSVGMANMGHISVRVLGVLLMSCGSYACIAQTILYLLWRDPAYLFPFVVSAGLILLGFPLLFSSKALNSAVGSSVIFRPLAIGLLGFREAELQDGTPPFGRRNVAFIWGLPFGILSYFVHPLYLLIGLLGAVFAYIILIRPECGYYIALLFLPYFIIFPRPSTLLAILVLYTYLAGLLKRILGKRYFHPELLDVFVWIYLGVTVLGGLVSFGGNQSLQAAGIYAILMLGYFLTVSFVNTKEKLLRTVRVLTASLFGVAAYGLYQNFTGNVSAEWIDTSMFDNIAGRVVSTFENPNMLGVFLIAVLPMILAMALTERSRNRMAYWIVALLGLLCLVYTWARGAWLGFLFAIVVFLLIFDRRTFGLLVAGVCAFPFLLPYLPTSIVSRFTSIGDLSDTSTNFRVYIWRGCVNMLQDYYVTGLGIGERAFQAIYPYYAFAGIEKAPHAHNLFLQILLSVGVFGFAAFLFVLVAMAQSGFTLAKNGESKTVRMIGCGAMCGVLGTLVQGMTDYVWYNYRVFFMFWVAVGIVSAAGRINSDIRRKHRSGDNGSNAEALL